MINSSQHSTTVIFDLDGTLIDSVGDIANAVNDVLTELGFPTHDIEFYKENIGGGINDLIQCSLPKNHSVKPEAYIERLDYYYIDHLNKTTEVYPYIMDTLDFLRSKNVPIAVVSNKRHPFTIDSVDKFFKEYIEIAIGSGKQFPLKPDPTSSHHVLKRFNAKPELSYFVGDTEYDIKTAHNAGMISLGVLWGMSDKDKLESFNPDYLFEDPKSMLGFFEENLRHI